MGKRRTGVLLIVVGIVIAAAVGLSVYVTVQKGSGPVTIPMRNVVVATLSIPERTVLQDASLELRSVPADLVPGGALTSLDQVVGRMNYVPIFPNQVILTPMLADTKGQSGVSFTLEKGEVLISFPATDIVNTGSVRAGDRVDILVTIRPPDLSASSQTGSPGAEDPRPNAVKVDTTQFNLQNLRVVTIGALASSTPRAQSRGTDPSELITFAVSRENALILKALKDSPEVVVELALRAAGDEETQKTAPVTIDGLVQKYGMR